MRSLSWFSVFVRDSLETVKLFGVRAVGIEHIGLEGILLRGSHDPAGSRLVVDQRRPRFAIHFWTVHIMQERCHPRVSFSVAFGAENMVHESIFILALRLTDEKSVSVMAIIVIRPSRG